MTKTKITRMKRKEMMMMTRKMRKKKPPLLLTRLQVGNKAMIPMSVNNSRITLIVK